MDQAGWHLTPKLVLPTNISIVAIPSKCPKLNPQENIWQFMRDNWLSNRVFGSYDEIVDDIAVTPGTSSSNSPGRSCLSACEIGHMRSDH